MERVDDEFVVVDMVNCVWGVFDGIDVRDFRYDWVVGKSVDNRVFDVEIVLEEDNCCCV